MQLQITIAEIDVGRVHSIVLELKGVGLGSQVLVVGNGNRDLDILDGLVTLGGHEISWKRFHLNRFVL